MHAPRGGCVAPGVPWFARRSSSSSSVAPRIADVRSSHAPERNLHRVDSASLPPPFASRVRPRAHRRSAGGVAPPLSCSVPFTPLRVGGAPFDFRCTTSARHAHDRGVGRCRSPPKRAPSARSRGPTCRTRQLVHEDPQVATNTGPASNSTCLRRLAVLHESNALMMMMICYFLSFFFMRKNRRRP